MEPGERIFPEFRPPEHLIVLDMAGVDPALHPLITTLQGLVNRVEPRIYLVWTWQGREWLEETIAPEGVTHEECVDPLELLLRFKSELSGCIIYDPSNPHTINLATTMSGILNATAVHPEYSDMLVNAGIPVVADLRGRWSADEAAGMYAWALDKYWRDCTHRILCHLDPAQHHLRDYLVACRIFTFFCDIGNTGERAFMESIFSREDVSVNTPVLGYFPQYEAFGIANERGCFQVTSNFAPSLTVHSAMVAETPLSQERKTPPPLGNRTYVTFIISDGTGVNYNLDHLRYQWDDPARGDVPIGWTTNPLLIELAPAVAEWYYRKATDNDYFIAAPTGIGTVYPTSYPDLGSYTGITARYLDRMDLTEVCVWNFPDQGDLGTAQQLIGELGLSAVIENTRESMHRVSGGIYIGTPMQIVCDSTETMQEKALKILKSINERVTEGQAPGFVCVSLASCDITPSLLREVASSLGDGFSVIRPDEFVALLDRARPVEILWERWQETQDVEMRNRIVETGDGNFIVGFNIYREEVNSMQRHVMKLDSAGELIWDRDYGDGIISCLVGTPDGGALAYYENEKTSLIFRVDREGNDAWSREIPRAPYMMIQAGVDRYLLAGDDDLLQQIYLTEIDGGGDIIWENAYHHPCFEGIHICGIAESKGDLYVLSYSVASYPGLPLLLKVDSSGSRVWRKELCLSSASGIAGSNTGGVVITGKELDPMTQLFMTCNMYPQIIFLLPGFLTVILLISWKLVKKIFTRHRKRIFIISVSLFASLYLLLLIEGFPWYENQHHLQIIKIDGNGRLEWKRNDYDYLAHAHASSIASCDDGSYIVAGGIESTSYKGYDDDIYILKINEKGGKMWDRTYEALADDPREWMGSIAPSKDGGLLGVQCYEDDIYCLGIDTQGRISWEEVFGDMVCIYDAAETGDSSYVVAGTTHANASGPSDAYILKMDPDGKKVWERTYGGDGWDSARSIVSTMDGYTVAGTTTSTGKNDRDILVFQTDANGDITWNITTGTPGSDTAEKILGCDDGYLVAGNLLCGPHGGDIYLMKMDKQGKILWEKTYTDEQRDQVKNIAQCGDDGYYIFARRNLPYDGRTYTGIRHGIILIRIDREGNRTWEKQIRDGGSGGYEVFDDIEFMTCDGRGGMIIGGTSETGKTRKLFTTKIDGEGNITWDRTHDTHYTGIPKDILRVEDGGFIIVGEYGAHLVRIDGLGEIAWEERMQNGIGNFVTGGSGGAYLAGGYSKSMADRWYLVKLKEYLHE